MRRSGYAKKSAGSLIDEDSILPGFRAAGQWDGSLEIMLVADRMMNASTLPPEIRWDEGQRQTCLRCYYHDDIDQRKPGTIFLTERQEAELAAWNIPVFESVQKTLMALKKRITACGIQNSERLQWLYNEILVQNEAKL